MTLQKKLDDILDSFQQKKILIVGDVMLDEYLWGNVTRISPEAPIPVVSCTKREYRMGGAANVAINVDAMKAEPILCSVIGDDETGKTFLNLLDKRKMNRSGIIESSKRKTTVKTRVIGNHQHLLRVDDEITFFLDYELEQQLLLKANELLRNFVFDAIIFQDYDKGILTEKIIKEITNTATTRGIHVLVDPKKRSFLNYKKVTLFKPNYKELTEGLNQSVSKDDAQGIFNSVLFLHEKNEIQYIMVTLSEKGVFISDGKKYRIIPAIERDVADVSGAGDTVICIAALSTAAGLDAFQTAELANLAGGIVCEKAGVVPITPELLIHEKTNLI